jgi:small subunit ribosomal protein S9
MATIMFWGTGRRKNAVARVRIMPGNGLVRVNGRAFEEYFPMQVQRQRILEPLVAIKGEGRFDIVVRVAGGGISGQAGAVRHGLARALIKSDHNFRSTLKKEGFLTRDPRMKERRKYGLKKARKRPQFSKR